MKVSRELKVGVLAILCAVILYFGLNFLKGMLNTDENNS